MSAVPKRTSSGKHPEVKALRAKFASVADNEGRRLQRINAKLEDAVKKIESDRPRDARREEGDSNIPIPIDVVSFADAEAPTKPTQPGKKTQ